GRVVRGAGSGRRRRAVGGGDRGGAGIAQEARRERRRQPVARGSLWRRPGAGLTMRLCFISAAALVVAGGSAVMLHHRAQPYHFHYENVLGTSMEITVLAVSEPAGQAGAAAALERIDRDAKILSGYD